MTVVLHQLNTYSTDFSKRLARIRANLLVFSWFCLQNEIETCTSDGTLYYPFVWILVLIQFWMPEEPMRSPWELIFSFVKFSASLTEPSRRYSMNNHEIKQTGRSLWTCYVITLFSKFLPWIHCAVSLQQPQSQTQKKQKFKLLKA